MNLEQILVGIYIVKMLLLDTCMVCKLMYRKGAFFVVLCVVHKHSLFGAPQPHATVVSLILVILAQGVGVGGFAAF